MSESVAHDQERVLGPCRIIKMRCFEVRVTISTFLSKSRVRTRKTNTAKSSTKDKSTAADGSGARVRIQTDCGFNGCKGGTKEAYA